MMYIFDFGLFFFSSQVYMRITFPGRRSEKKSLSLNTGGCVKKEFFAVYMLSVHGRGAPPD